MAHVEKFRFRYVVQFYGFCETNFWYCVLSVLQEKIFPIYWEPMVVRKIKRVAVIRPSDVGMS